MQSKNIALDIDVTKIINELNEMAKVSDVTYEKNSRCSQRTLLLTLMLLR